MKEIFSLKGKTAIVTGGASGIGKAISKKFIENGAYVIILEYDDSKIQSFKQAVDKGYEFHQCDISHFEEVQNVLGEIQKKHTVDILINNAGIAHIGNIENTSASNLDSVYNVNVKGVYNCTHAVIAGMKKRNKGCILNMASIASVVGISDRFAYSMSKGAVLTMTYSIAKDYVDFGIRCNCISPARVHTPFVDGFLKENYPGQEKEMFDKLSKTQPIGRMGLPEEVASLALYLCSDEAAFITGTNYPIDGGFIKINS